MLPAAYEKSENSPSKKVIFAKEEYLRLKVRSVIIVIDDHIPTLYFFTCKVYRTLKKS